MELAQQLVDVVTLRPESQLCYVGLVKECFEILEAEPSSRARGIAGSSALDTSMVADSNTPSVAGNDNETASNGSFSDDDESTDGAPHGGAIDTLDDQSESESTWASDGESLGDMDSDNPWREFQARQILFYDEVAVFKARRVKL